MKELSLMRLYHNDLKSIVPKQEIEKHLKFVVMLVNRLCRSVPSNNNYRDDMIQAGNLGLIEAVKKYDPTIGKFTSYALFWIRCYVAEELHKARNPVNIPLKQIVVCKKEPLKYYSTNDHEHPLEITSPENFEYNLFKKQIVTELNKALLKVLPSRELELIRLYYHNDLTFTEAGKQIGVSKQRVHQLISNAYAKLKNDTEIQRVYKMYQDLMVA
jgi:RNA polymerase sigma factor (sigma-70 family)